MGLLRSLIVVAAAAGVAHADPVVLAIDGNDIYIGLGAKDGVGAGSELELQHEIVAKDPRTGTVLRDHFALGTLAVVKAGDGLCVARADAELAKRVLAGDHVRLVSAKKAFVDPWEQQVLASKTDEPSGPGAPDHAALARDAWQDTLGKPPEQRIARWQTLLETDPTTPYRKSVTAEMSSLRGQIHARDAALAAQKRKRPDERDPKIVQLSQQLAGQAGVLLMSAIDHAVPAHPLEVAFLMRSPATIGQAWLYVRSAGEPGFHRVELARDGDAYLRGTIDAALVHGDRLEWYTEAAAPDAPSEPVNGSQAAPNWIAIDRDVREAPMYPDRSQIAVHVDYVDFQGKGRDGFDQYYQAEAEFQYRFLDPIYSVRLGAGTLSGSGGPKTTVADSTTCTDADGKYKCKRVDFNYVYTELEYEVDPFVHVMLRPQIGQLTTDEMEGSSPSRCRGPDTTQCRLAIGFGGRARVRFGDERRTNLVLGVAANKGVGALFEAAYQWLPVPIMPVQVSVQVTDQPVSQDFGVRLIGDVGLRRASWIYPSVRVSYQARSLALNGISGGLGLNFDW